MSDSVKHLIGLLAIFNKYASKDQDKDHLNKSELKELLMKEFPMLLNESSKPDEVNKILAALDHDGDGQVDIQEYMVTLCALGCCLSEALKDCQKKK